MEGTYNSTDNLLTKSSAPSSKVVGLHVAWVWGLRGVTRLHESFRGCCEDASRVFVKRLWAISNIHQYTRSHRRILGLIEVRGGIGLSGSSALCFGVVSVCCET